MEAELKEEILASLDSKKLKEKVESLTPESTPTKEADLEGRRDVENGRF